MKKPESILFLCAHNDDQIVGAGGTIAKYAKEGKNIVTVVFSFGEITVLHLQEKIGRKTRVIESKRAGKLLGENELYYLGLKESNFKAEIEEKDIQTKVKNIIKRVKPDKIFTHAVDDPHPDHKVVHKFTMDLIDKINYKGEVYSFNVWNLFLNFRKRELPRLIVDITDTFKVKTEAFRKHKSQWIARLSLTWNIYFQAIWYGFENHVKYAEIFYKIR